MLLYTTEPGTFWSRLGDAAQAAGAVWHDAPPEVTLELRDGARLYVCERQVSPPTPHEVRELGGGAREIVIDCYDRPAAEPFLAGVLDGVPGFVDADDDGNVVSTKRFAAAVRAT